MNLLFLAVLMASPPPMVEHATPNVSGSIAGDARRIGPIALSGLHDLADQRTEILENPEP